MSPVIWSRSKRILLFAEAWNIHVDSTLEFCRNFLTLYHLDELELFLSGLRVLRTNFPKILVDVVVKGVHLWDLWFENNYNFFSRRYQNLYTL